MILVATDPRYLGISSERERERLFTEFISQKKLKERDEIRIAKQKSIEEFKSYLEENHVTINSQWHKIYEYSKDSDIVKTLGNLECINVYTEYMKKLEKDEKDLLKAELMDRGFKSRKARENFRELLDEAKLQKLIHFKCRWRQFRPHIKDDDRYIAMLGDIDGSTPAELFYDVVEILEEDFQIQRKRLKNIALDMQVDNLQTIPFERFHETIKRHEDFRLIDNQNLKLAFTEIQEKILENC